MLPSDMNLRIGKVKNYNNEILISSPSFEIGTNVKINLDKDEPDVKPKMSLTLRANNEEHKQDIEPNTDSNKNHKQDVKPNIELRKEDTQAVKMIKTEPNKITYEEEKVALILGSTAVFTLLWMFK